MKKHSSSFSSAITILLGGLTFFAGSLTAQHTGGVINPTKMSEQTIESRKAIRYEHKALAEWGYSEDGKDYFHLVPAKSKNAPLRVILHSVGHTGDKVLADAFKNHAWLHYYDSADFNMLYLDCSKRGNKKSWWGWYEIRKNMNLYQDRLSPTEARVMSTVEWVIQNYNVDRNRVYLSGISMGGSGSLGIGMARGDVFAAVSVAVPAGIGHMKFRMTNGKHQDPPPLFDFSSQVDRWSRDQGELMEYFLENKYPLVYAWGTFGHKSNVSSCNPAVVKYPWLSIKRNEAYPVFTKASSDDKYPGYMNKKADDQWGQINGYFRWKNITDGAAKFAMELRMVKADELSPPSQWRGTEFKTPDQATANITLRRLQEFAIQPSKTYSWSLVSAGQKKQSGQTKSDKLGVLTISDVVITKTPVQLIVEKSR